MRLSRLLALALVAAPTAARGDDTADFLKPSNWEGRADLWTVKDGSIVGETKEDPKYNTFLCTKGTYGDFELSFKVQLRDGVGNSGVQIRSARKDQAGDKLPFRVSGPQVDIGKGYFGGLYGEGVGGYLLAPKKALPKEKEGEFNDYHIVAKGNHVTVKLNGAVTVDEDFPMSNAKSKDPKPAPTEGIIALQVHSGYPKMRVEFKDVVFKKLK